MSERLWTESTRETAPLSGLLHEKARTARTNAEALNIDQLRNRTTDEIVAHLCANWSQFAQTLVVGQIRSYHEPELVDRHDRESSERYRYWRWAFRVEVDGDLEILERWPESFDRTPLDGDDQFEPAPGPWLRSFTDSVILLADVRFDENPTGDRPPADQITWIADYLTDAVLAANEQVAEYDRALRHEVAETITRRWERLERIAQGNAEVVALVRSRVGPLEVVEAEKGPAVEVVVDSPEPSAPTTVDLRYALYGASAADLIAAVRKWRDGVETYPSTFVKLDEEDISSLLVTTLNTVFDSAQREVFRAAGKTDIYVQAHRGEYDKAAHIAEAKIWSGQGEVSTDLGQLLSYANARTESQLLLYYVRHQNIGLIAGRCAEALRAHARAGHIDSRDRYDLALIVEHPSFKSPVALTVMFVHLPTAGAVDPDAPAA